MSKIQESISSGIFSENVTKSEERGKPRDNILHSKMSTAEGISFATGEALVERYEHSTS